MVKNSSPDDRSFHIARAVDAQQLAAVRNLFVEFVSSLDFDLNFQDFDKELTSLPGKYAPPLGELLLASVDEIPAGCIALRPLDNVTCEMKRLWVRPEFRGIGLGRMLAERIVVAAEDLKYRKMKLDTVASMVSATSLYRSLGFVETEPYTFNPLDDAMYFELDLKSR